MAAHNLQKTVIFDMDGVIFDTEYLFLNCWREIAREYKIEGIDPVYHRCIGVKAEETERIFEEAYGHGFFYKDFAAKSLVLFHRYVADNGMPVKPGVYELLEDMTAQGWKIGLASSTAEKHVKSQLASCSLLSRFQTVICGDMVSRGKPAPDIFLRACKEIGTQPEEAYAIEDSFNGIRAAAAAGMKAIMVPDIVPPDDEIKGLAYRIFGSLMEVQNYFNSNL